MWRDSFQLTLFETLSLTWLFSCMLLESIVFLSLQMSACFCKISVKAHSKSMHLQSVSHRIKYKSKSEQYLYFQRHKLYERIIKCNVFAPSNSQGGCVSWVGFVRPPLLSLHVILQESLFSTVIMFNHALHAQNLYRQTLRYEQSSNLYLYMFKILKADSLVIARLCCVLCSFSCS